ncbi:programmed cell death protein 2-like isoform X2 [Carassius gibelio]|uniref:programmed cell death protein 2-like isoform X2 n=1 Tax=Carassius gibelio TaxID=101364 RepID=UPI0022780019|nr:programmed cell death protein 2-like isoform X2 [Carassius gibelio]
MATSLHETVLIGICDGVIDQKKTTSYCTNKTGDRPDLLPVISLQHPTCALCRRGLSQVVQIYCPLAASQYHRTIHVFACTSPQCSGKSESWTVLRSQCLVDDIKSRQNNKTTACADSAMSRTDWCDEADDWGMDDAQQVEESAIQMPDDSTGEGNDVSSRLQDLCIDGDHQSGLQPTDVPVFQAFYISVMEETDLDGFRDTDHEDELLREYEEREGVKVREIQRYSWAGSPLLIAEPRPSVSQTVPVCAHCGSPRVFEFQLMPALVSLLGSADPDSDVCLEFGTVLVFTCRNSCWKSGSTAPVEEFLVVQPDPDQKLFKS